MRNIKAVLCGCSYGIRKTKGFCRVTLFITFLLLTYSKLYGQINLVPNFSFEDTLLCPSNTAQIPNSPPWYQPTIGTPDYFNSCDNGPVDVPDNLFGSQLAKTGNAYAGLAAYTSGGSYREYISVRLVDSLQPGNKYCVRFYVNLAGNSQYAISNVGAYLSSDSIYNWSTFLNLPYVPQVANSSGNFITDTSNWVLISGTFVSVSNEKFLTIGNFYDNLNTDSVLLLGAMNVAYYYIDDVSVTLCDDSSSISIPNVFSPNNDGMNDIFQLNTTSLESVSCKIYNRWGTIVYDIRGTGDFWDGRTTSGQECEEGVYYYVLIAKGEDGVGYEQSGFLHLMK